MRRAKFLLSVALLLGAACAKAPPNLSALGTEPEWRSLAAYGEALTTELFQALTLQVYGYDDGWAKYLRLEEKTLEVKTRAKSEATFSLPLARDAASKKEPPRYWRTSPLRNPTRDKPLAGLRIALDPGHLGGAWARMEDRWFRPEGQAPVAEGDLTLLVAKKLRTRLEGWGAEVFLTRESAEPVTPLRPKDLEETAAKYLDEGQDLNLARPEAFRALPREEQVRRVSELLFYRVAEIRARAALVNQRIRPDLTVCLHFNAGDWGDPEAPRLAASNHLHVLIPGAVEAGEWAFDDVRFETLRRMLDGSHFVERPLAEAVAEALARSTGLPPALVPGGSVKKVGDNPYLWSRNLLANRLYENPTIFLEAYVMNHPETIARIQAGDFSGRRNIAGQEFSSLYEDYAGGVAAGILEYFRKTSP
ncbi:hypothetical protein FBR05_12400 [Deltaproteobacteria bacterium PRO3]|nr:hypothetical protein [Deltaproteobacteria bacterium PRO3]